MKVIKKSVFNFLTYHFKSERPKIGKEHLGINLTKYMWELYAENHKTPKKEILKVLKRQRDIPSSWIERLKYC